MKTIDTVGLIFYYHSNKDTYLFTELNKFLRLLKVRVHMQQHTRYMQLYPGIIYQGRTGEDVDPGQNMFCHNLYASVHCSGIEKMSALLSLLDSYAKYKDMDLRVVPEHIILRLCSGSTC